MVGGTVDIRVWIVDADAVQGESRSVQWMTFGHVAADAVLSWVYGTDALGKSELLDAIGAWCRNTDAIRRLLRWVAVTRETDLIV